MTSFFIDNGTFEMKCGIVSSKKCVSFPSIVGYEYGSDHAKVGDYSVGKEALKTLKTKKSNGEAFTLKYQIQRGMFMSWDQLEAVWNYCFTQSNIKSETNPFFTTCNALTPKSQRQSLTEIAFEIFKVPSFYLEIPAVLSFYGEERETGIAVESGSGITHIIPMNEGKPNLLSMKRFALSGQDISEQLIKLVVERGYSPIVFDDLKVTQHIKKNMLYCCTNINEELIAVKNDKSKQKEVELKSGEKIILDKECFLSTEIMFDPTLVGVKSYGLSKILYDMINSYDEDDRKGIYRNIVLGGNNCLIEGFGDRIESDLKLFAAKDDQKFKKINPTVCDEYSTWKGVKTYIDRLKKTNWISDSEYKEKGKSIVFEKCF
jgi:actin